MYKENLDLFFEIIESDLKKRKRFLTILAVIIGSLLLLPLKSVFWGNTSLLPSQIYSYIFLILCVAMMFVIGFYSIHTKSNFHKRKDFQWFINNPENVTNYKIISGDIPKIELIGDHQKVSFFIKSPLPEAEKRLFVVFPHLKPQQKIKPHTINIKEINIIEQRAALLNMIPKELTSYFMSMEKYPFDYLRKKWLSILLSILIMIIFGLSAYSYFTGTPDFFIFGYKNAAFYLLIWIGLAAILYPISDYEETKKWLRFFQKDTSQIVWIYTSESKNSINGIPMGKTYGIYLANSEGKKLHIPLTSDRLSEVYEWLNCYFDKAISGYLHQYENHYKRNPRNFISQINNINL